MVLLCLKEWVMHFGWVVHLIAIDNIPIEFKNHNLNNEIGLKPNQMANGNWLVWLAKPNQPNLLGHLVEIKLDHYNLQKASL